MNNNNNIIVIIINIINNIIIIMCIYHSVNCSVVLNKGYPYWLLLWV